MAKGAARAAAVTAAVGLILGCTTSAVRYVGFQYYYYGPEETLELIDENEVPPADMGLLDLERAVALLELGRYEESLAALGRARGLIDVADESSPSTTNGDGDPPWRPELHERVLVSTIEIANSFALQETRAAAAAADRAMEIVDGAGCDPCRFHFTRVLSAIAYEGVGRFADGLDAVADMSVLGRGEDLVGDLRNRLHRGVGGVEPEGLAPPPVGGERTLTVVLLLGRGPYKDADALAVNQSEAIPWCRYLPRDPQAVTWAALEIEEPEISVGLTDVEDLAVASLKYRADRVVADHGAGSRGQKRDLRHWATLPASLQLLTVDLPGDEDFVDLVYYSPDGYEVDRETIELPEGWVGGRLFVTRRMP